MIHSEEIENPYHIQLDNFEGPLDLLLHLIKENQVDIYNIPVAKITEQYLETINMMKELSLDVAGEFLVMAATLAQIKSQMLLPPTESALDPEDEGQDPRAELIRRLLEYQKYKDAATQLFARPLLDRDVFKRERYDLSLYRSTEPAELAEVSIFKLVEAFHRILQNFHFDEAHEVEAEQISISSRVEFVLEAMKGQPHGIDFNDLFKGHHSRTEFIATFLAVLEMLKRGALRVFQAESFSGIQLLGTSLLQGDWTYDGRDTYSGNETQINP